ncbi:hypothetical protein [Zavarzinella formosa]|uniref:hypothetical protein n=1 Tax=Zavarzinella formosa TaxID=360055 RepID=UPI0002DDC8C4|nr:hypothetical protein [Zavarzinella formosa]
MLDDFSKHQQGIIKRYYRNLDKIQVQRLAELVTDIYLAEGKKLEKLWLSAGESMKKLEVPQNQIDNLMAKRDPALLASLVKQLMAG